LLAGISNKCFLPLPAQAISKCACFSNFVQSMPFY